MGMDTGGGGSTRRRGRGRRNSAPMSAINVTPMVDVMLVLLIIFMVAAPLMISGVEVDLPDAASPPVEGQDEPLAVSVNNKGEIFLQDTQVTMENLVPKLQAIVGQKSDQRIFVRGDDQIAYGKVIEVVAAITEAGFKQVSLLTEIPASKLP